MRLDLADDPAVIAMAEILGTSEHFVVGCLHAIWSWASRNSDDGSVTGVSPSALGRVTRCDGVPEAMVAARWLEIKKMDGLTVLRFPHWDRWNSQSAKRRALTARRTNAYRKRNCDAPSVTETSPHNSTVHNKKPPPPTPSKNQTGNGRGGGGAEEEGGFDALAAELKAIGLSDVPGALAAVRSRGESEQSALAAVIEYQAKRPAYGPGALYWRLTRGTWPEQKKPLRESSADSTRREYLEPIQAAKASADCANGLGDWRNNFYEGDEAE